MSFLRSFSVLVLLNGLVGGCATPRAADPLEGERDAYLGPGTRLGARLAAKADHFQRHIEARHLAPEGLLVYRRTRPDGEAGPWRPLTDLPPGSYGNLSDGVIWTGCYLAAQAFRYRVTGEPAALVQVRRAVDGLALLTEITGVRGLYARSFDRGRRPGPEELPHHEWRQGSGRFSAYRYRGDVSKDQYAGLIFGLAVAHRLVDDDRIRESCRVQLEAIGDHLLANDLRIVDVDGEPTRFGDLRGRILGLPIGVNALIALSALKAAHQATGEARFEKEYRRLASGKGYLRATYWAKIQLFGKTNHNNDLMGLLGLYTLLQEEEDARYRSLLLRGMEKTFTLVGEERNSLYNGIYCSTAGVHERLLEDALDSLDRFPRDKTARPLDLSSREDIPRSFWKNRKGRPRARQALPLDQRPVTSFAWRSCPYGLVRGVDPTRETVYAGCDYLLAYWLLRHHGLAPGEAASRARAAPGIP